MADYYDDHFWRTPFPDVPPDHWAYEAIIRIKKRRVMSGYPDGKFKPENSATRAELASAIDKDYVHRFEVIESCKNSVVRVEAGRDGKVLSIGSGVALDEKRVATNVHVILPGMDGGFVNVTCGNQTARAHVPWGDGARDCAVLEVEGLKLKPVEFSVQKTVGEEVFAIGFPLGLGYSVSRGIVSRIARYKAYEEWVNFVQTDAAINPGNSGGGLFNRYGELIAMPTKKYVTVNNIPVDNMALCLAADEILRVWDRVRRGETGLVNLDAAAFVEVMT